MKYNTFIQSYFDALSAHNATDILMHWHENGQLMINSEKKPLDFLTTLPPIIGFRLKKTILLEEDEIVIVKCHWEMTMPESIGHHVSYISMVETNEQIKIIAMLDIGNE